MPKIIYVLQKIFHLVPSDPMWDVSRDLKWSENKFTKL